MTGNLFSTFTRLSGWVLGLLAVAVTLENLTRASLPPGTLLCLIEFLAGASCVVWTYRSQNKERRSFANAISFIVLADTLFYFLNYYHPVNLNLENISLFSSLLYAFGFLIVSQSLIRSAGLQIQRDWKKFLIPGLISLITFLFYFVPSISMPAEDTGIRLAVQALVLPANLIASIVSLTVLIYSMNPFLILLSFGITTLPLINFSISAEIFARGHLEFGFYEYFWAFGLFFAEAALVFLAKHLDEEPRLSIVSGRSIGVQYKTSIISVVMFVLIGSSILAPRELLSIRVITSGIVIGIIFAVIVSSFAVEAVSRYSTLLGRYLEQGFTSKKWSDDFIHHLPVELEVLFSAVFAQSLEKERDRQLRANRYNELHQKFAHDIRSPLKAVTQLISSATFEDSERKEACQTSLQSMTRASQSILNELELNSGVSLTQVSMPAIRLSSVIRRVIQTFEFSQPLDSPNSVRFDDRASRASVWIDETLIERLLLNILQNSAESLRSGEIQISTQVLNERVILEIVDQGPGTDAETLKLLNQGKSVSRKSEGHGIGLSGHREALIAAGGSIHFESTPGRFFKTTIQLPCASSKIILIDDDRAIHLAWKTLAKLKDVELITLTPQAPLPSLSGASQPEIYVDYHLGGKSGLSVLEELQKAGFTKLFLATSDEVSAEIRANWKVRDKSFPRA